MSPRWIAVRVPRGIDDRAHWAVAERRDTSGDYAIIEYGRSLADVTARIETLKREARVEATQGWRARERGE